jgi:hypothetical protein
MRARTRFLGAAAGVVALLLLGSAATALGEDGARKVELTWSPTDSFTRNTWPSITNVSVGQVTVSLPEGPIWKNVEKEEAPVLFYADAAAIKEYIAKALAIVFWKRNGKYKLNVEVTELQVQEGNLYEGRAMMHVTLVDENQQEVWNALVGSTSKRWGRSLKAENFNETIGSCVSDIIIKIAGEYPDLKKYF